MCVFACARDVLEAYNFFRRDTRVFTEDLDYVHIETIRRARSQEATRAPVVVRAVAAGAWLPALQTRTGSVVSALLL